jgi:hypothetical protein
VDDGAAAVVGVAPTSNDGPVDEDKTDTDASGIGVTVDAELVLLTYVNISFYIVYIRCIH